MEAESGIKEQEDRLGENRESDRSLCPRTMLSKLLHDLLNSTQGIAHPAVCVLVCVLKHREAAEMLCILKSSRTQEIRSCLALE